jgi:hypothetical protein
VGWSGVGWGGVGWSGVEWGGLGWGEVEYGRGCLGIGGDEQLLPDGYSPPLVIFIVTA